MRGGFVLATLPAGDDVLHADGVFGQVMGRMWDTLLGEALPERASLELIEKLGSEL